MYRLKELRTEKRISEDELAERFQVTQQAISAYENGSKDIGTEMLSEFADFFDCSTDYLQGKTPTRKWDTEGLAFSAHDIDGLTDEDIAAAKLIIEGLKAKHQTKKK